MAANCKVQQNTIHVLGWWEKAIHSPFYLAGKHEVLRPYMQAVEKGMRLRSTLSHKLLAPVANLSMLPKAEKRNVKRALEYLDAVGKEPEGATIRVEGTRPGGAPLDLVGSNVGDVIELSPQGHQVLQDIRKAVKSYYSHLKHATAASIGIKLEEMDSIKESNPDGYELLKAIEESERQGYIPRIRMGDVKFTVTFPDGRVHQYTAAPQGLDAVKFGKSRVNAAIKEAEKIKRAIKAKYKLGDDAFGPIKTTEMDSIIDDVRKGNINAVEGLMAALLNPKKLKDMKLGDGEGEVPVLQLFKKMREEQAKQGQMRHMRQRKDVPGYVHPANFDSYFESALASYFVRGADLLGGLYTSRERSDAINVIDNENLRNWARDHNRAMQEPQSLAWMKNLAFNYSLGWNMASAAINLTQNLHTTWPYLSMMGDNPVRASIEIAKAFKDTSTLFEGSLKPLQMGSTIFNEEKIPQLVKSGKLTKEEAAFLKDLIDQGITQPISTQELVATDSEIRYGQAYDKLSPYARGFLNTASFMFSSVEQMNRMTAGLATYRMLKASPSMQQKMVRWKKLSSIYDDAPNTPEFLARMAVEDTQFVMTKENRPAFMRGNLMGVATQFQQYPMAMLELIMKVAKFADPKQKALFGALLGVGLMSTAGIWGMPFARPLKELVEGVSKGLSPILGNDPVTFEIVKEAAIEVGRLLNSEDPEYVADALLNGMTRLLGVETGRRTALEIVPTDIFTGSAMDLTGPFGGVVIGGGIQFAQYWSAGEEWRALASLLPLAARNAYEGLSGDMRTPETGRSRIPAGSMTHPEKAFKLAGFTPARVARIGEEAQELGSKPLQGLRQSYQKSISTRLVDSLIYESLGNDAAADESRKEAQALIEKIRRHDEGVVDPNRRIMPDEDRFLKSIESRIKRDIEGPLGEEADRLRGLSKAELEYKRARIQERKQ